MMMRLPFFCSECGAANDPAHSHCFACGQLLSREGEACPSPNMERLYDRYQIETCLGSGGFSLVYRARDLQTGERPVAIKQISLRGLSAQKAIEATETFHREVRVLSALRHAQVPQLYDHFSDQDHWYLVLEYIEGQTLETFLATRGAQGKPLQWGEILAITLQLCQVLGYLHSRQPPVIFRDLKPGNIMRTPDGSLYLIDFGIARYYQPGQAQDTQRLGSPGYAAPEQYGRAQTTPQADIYSLGALLHFLLSGQDPVESVRTLPPLRLNGQPGSAELEELIASMLSPNPSERPATVHEVVTTLEAINQQRVIQNTTPLWQSSLPQMPQIQPSSAPGQQHLYAPVQPGSLPLPSARGRVNRRNVLIALGTLAVAAGTGGGIWWMNTSPHPSPSYIYKGHSSTVEAVAWSPDGNLIASASDDHTVQIWGAAHGENFITYQGHADAVSGVAWSPDGKRIASVSYDLTLQVWDAANGSHIFTYPIGNTWIGEAVGFISNVKAVAWSPDGKWIASSSTHTAQVVEFPHGGWSASGITYTVQVWDAANGGHVFTYQGHSSEVNTLAWSPDSKRIASASAFNSTVQIWDAIDGGHVFKYRGHAAPVSGVAWSPDGKRIASISLDGNVHVWNATDGGNVFTYQSQILPNSTDDTTDLHGYPRVAWSPDGKRIASTGNDMMRVWGATDGNNVFTYQSGDADQSGDSDAVEAVAWSPDSKRIASACLNATVQVWNVQ